MPSADFPGFAFVFFCKFSLFFFFGMGFDLDWSTLRSFLLFVFCLEIFFVFVRCVFFLGTFL